MLKLENITVKVDDRKLLDNVTVDFLRGKMNLIIGPNGSGKSTLIKATSKQLPIASGSITYADRKISDLSLQELAKFRAVLSQHVEIAFPLKVWEVVMMGRHPHFTTHPGSSDQQAVREAMDHFEVTELAERDYTTLSGGEKQRVNFARVLAQIWFPERGHYRYLLMDEPLTFLDIHFQYQFMQKLQELNRKNEWVIICVVHDLNLASRFGDNILLLKGGKILACGTSTEVLTKENIQTAFAIEPKIHNTEESILISF